MRVGPQGTEKPAILDEGGVIRDLSGHLDDLAGPSVGVDALDKLRGLDLSSLPELPGDTRIGAALAWVQNFYCVGLNYARHAAETNSPEPAEPILFSKATSALHAPNDDIVIVRDSRKSDWEVELGVVIGKEALHVSEEDALDHVAGYCTINDLSEREFQIERMGQWIKGKSAPTYGPVGPWLVTRDEIADPQALDMELVLNGEAVQSSNTSDMIFTVRQIVSYMSRFMKLVPGDIIATGTPEGVGMGMKPQRFLKPGDRMEIEVKGLGRQDQTCVSGD
jgi:2-keto-4-pentenoate hydratase/2-oxohepta-3-ene-1,7-dioic acid hydratase in catechol pathway